MNHRDAQENSRAGNPHKSRFNSRFIRTPACSALPRTSVAAASRLEFDGRSRSQRATWKLVPASEDQGPRGPLAALHSTYLALDAHSVDRCVRVELA